MKLAGKGVSPGFSIYQVTVNKYILVRTNKGWKVSQRIVRPISAEDAHYIIRNAIEVND